MLGKNPNPIVRMDHRNRDPYRVVVASNNFILYPETWEPYRNGNNQPCDMIQGPCCCGAWHCLTEWEIEH